MRAHATLIGLAILTLAAAPAPPDAGEAGPLVCASNGHARVVQRSLPEGTRQISGTIRRGEARAGAFFLELMLTDGEVRHYAGIMAFAGPPPLGTRVSDRAIAHFGSHALDGNFEYARRPDGGNHFALPLIEAIDFTLEIAGDELRIAISWTDHDGPQGSKGVVPLRGIRPDRMILYCRNDDFALESLAFH